MYHWLTIALMHAKHPKNYVHGSCFVVFCCDLVMMEQIHRADSRFTPSQWEKALLCNDVSHWLVVFCCDLVMMIHIHRADSRFRPSQWGTALLCNNVSHWLVVFCCGLVMIIQIHRAVLGLYPANERRRYFVSTSLIGWVQAKNQPSPVFM